jgi:hypothetical protein
MAKAYKGFGNVAWAAEGIPLQTATTFVTQDAAGTPKTSPLAYSSSVITIAIPDTAIQLILCPTTDLRVSEDVAMARYDIILAGAKEVFAVALMTNVYIKRDTVDGTVKFRFAQV